VQKEFWITLECREPVCIGSYKSTQFIHTEKEIPGSVIRGALARYIGIKKGKDYILDAVSDMRFGFFRPISEGMSYPFPLTAKQCKRSPGFKNKGHGIFDTLFKSFVYDDVGGEHLWEKFKKPFNFECEKCGSNIEFEKGYYTKNENFAEVNVKYTSQTKVPIDNMRKSSREGVLYSITGIKPHTKFLGRIWGSDEQVKHIEEALEKFGVGALTGRGFGKVKAKEVTYHMDNIQDRIEKFNDKLKNTRENMLSSNKDANNSQNTYFSVDLLSPGIFIYPVPTLKLRLNTKDTIPEPVFWATAPKFVGGWSSALGLPKATHMAADIGSTYVFKSELKSDELAEILKDLETNGVGFRTDEGYGEVMICHPFHLEVTQV
jgi:CRISPR-associated protein Csx10